MNVAALVVTYNRLPLLKECIEALEKTEGLQIYVFDNASTDGTDLWLSRIKNNRIHVFRSSKNLGGAGGFSRGMKWVMKSDPDAIWLMDDDTIVQPDSLKKLMAAADAHPEYGFISSKALWTDGNENKMNHHRLKRNSDSKLPECREATFVSLLVNAEAVKKAGLPIEEYFIWGDDIEYTRRLSSMVPCFYAPESVVIHKTANNEGSNLARDDASRIGRYYYAYRNEVCSARNESPLRMIRQALKVLFHSLKVLLLAKDHKLKRLGMIWKASLDGLSFSPSIESVSNETNSSTGSLPGTH